MSDSDQAAPPSRRGFLAAACGLAAVGVGGLTLRTSAQATPGTADAHDYERFLRGREEAGVVEMEEALAVPGPVERAKREHFEATQDNILGPYYREGAAFRGKVTPPLEPGVVMLVRGRVWGLDTREPLAGAVIDLWQADHEGRYDNDDPEHPPAENMFRNRCRVVTDATGYYEYETVHPGAYPLGRERWRPPHIHYLVRAKGYQRLITQLYFRGDPHQAADDFIKPPLVIDLQQVRRGAGSFELGTFDIVLTGG